MPEDATTEFKRLAQNLMDTFKRDLGVTLTYDEQSLEYLDGYIARNREAIREKTGGQPRGIVNAIGSFLGECIIASYGGRWKQSEKGAWGVYFENNSAAFPFAKVQKAFSEDGHADSIASFYRISKLFQEGKIGQRGS
jgi:hypothetical protein